MIPFQTFFLSGFVLTRKFESQPTHRNTGNAVRLLLGAFLLVVILSVGSTPIFAQFLGPTPLNLVNGWTGAPFGTSLPTVELVNNIVQFRGAIASGTSPVAFTLPAALRPATNVYIQVDLCNANNGRLHIAPTGVVDVEVEKASADAKCFTSLDGASFALTASGFTPLTLINGWTNAPFSTSNAAVRIINGMVYFKGAIATGGANPQPFTLPAGFRPVTNVFVPIDLCNGNKGRLVITTTGAVSVQAETVFGNAQCFTSLDGAWFTAAISSGSAALTPINGWKNAPFGTSNALAGNSYGVVYFKGAISTTGTNPQAFLLPTRYRPVTNVYVPIDLCNGNKGRLFITTTGAVSVQAESGFGNAQCFTSLDGASFVQ